MSAEEVHAQRLREVRVPTRYHWRAGGRHQPPVADAVAPKRRRSGVQRAASPVTGSPSPTAAAAATRAPAAAQGKAAERCTVTTAWGQPQRRR